MTSSKTQPESARKSSAPGKAPPPAKDAIAMLRADHAEVKEMFAEYEKTRSVPRKKALVAGICTALGVHMQLEEEIFYPAVSAALKDKAMVPEAIVEHGGVKDLIAQLDGVEPDGELYDARVKVLSEYVKHHVKEEHEEMFPKVASSSIDVLALGARMAELKDELMAQAG